MAWQDRHYYRDQSGRTRNPLLWLFTGSVPLFTVFGIRVRAHAMMLVLIAWEMLMGMGFWTTMTFATVLFAIILLHEFGHCFAARSVGGEANDILMWPLGGLAYADAPQRAWPQFWTAVGGPLVNLAICFLSAAGLAVLTHSSNFLWNPLRPRLVIPYGSLAGYYLWFVFTLSWGLLLFNLLPAFPLDGGRMLQALLWFKLGRYRASMIAYVVGMIVSGMMMLYSLPILLSWYGGILFFIGLNCFWTCYSSRLALKAAGPYESEDTTDYSAAYEIEPTRKRSKLSRWTIRRAAKKARKLAIEERREQAHIDAILAKVSAHGMQSLTWSEKRALKKATEHQRQRDMQIPGK